MRLNSLCIIPGLFIFAIFAIGACLGSFFKLTVDRYGTNESIVFKPSYCFKCKTKLSWWQNIPILSFFILKGKCFTCKSPIDINCLYSEFTTSTIALLIFIHLWINAEPLIKLFLNLTIFMLLILLLMFDLKHRVIPHSITYPAIILIVIYQFIFNTYFKNPFLNLGIAFLFMDILYTAATVIKKFNLDQNLISIPLLIWSLGFIFFGWNIYFLFAVIVIYFLFLKLQLPEKLIHFLWFPVIFLVLYLIYKTSFIDLNVNSLSNYFVGIGVIYFICEAIAYLINLVFTRTATLHPKETLSSQIALGGGDITVFALISIFLGYKLAFLALFIASLLALISHFITRVLCLFSKDLKEQSAVFLKQIPFVPFLLLACFIIIMTINVS